MEPQRETPPYTSSSEFVSTRSLVPQDVRGESIPVGLHIYGRTEGNEKVSLGQEYKNWGNQDRLLYAVANGVTIAGVADEGQGADSVDILGQLLTDPNLRRRLRYASPREREKIVRGQLSCYSREYCNTGFAIAIAVGGRTVSGGSYEVEVYSAGNVAAFVATAGENYSQWRMVNSPEVGGRERTNLYKNFDVNDPAKVERTIIKLKQSDVLVLACDGVKMRGTDRRLKYSLPKYNGGSLEEYCRDAIAGASRLNLGQEKGQVFDDRTVMALRVR